VSRLSDAEVFVAVARAGGFSAAARELGLTQSALSRRVAALEARLGVRLLARSSRGVRPTDAGELFHAASQRALAELDAAEQSLVSSGRELRGTLRLHLPPALGRRVVWPLVARFAAQHPELRVHATLADRVVDLAAERADLAVRIGAPREPGLVVRRLGERRNVACASRAYLERRGAPRRPADLARHDALVLRVYAPRERWRFETESGVAEVEVTPHIVSNDTEALLEAALAGLGVAFLPEFVVADALRAGALVRVLEQLRGVPFPIVAVWPDRRLSPAARALVDHLAARLPAALPRSG
jgi:DNA-binding transcriptional LysR family regulator